MSILLNILDSKLSLPIPAESLPLQAVSDFVQSNKVFNLSSTTQNADSAIGYTLYKDALRTALNAHLDTVLDDTTNFVVDAIINKNELGASNSDIYAISQLEYKTTVTIRVTENNQNTPEQVATAQDQLSYFGLQVGTTPPADASGLAPYLGMYGVRTFSGIPVSETRNIVFAMPSNKAPIAKILLANLTDEFSDYVRTQNAFLIGNTSYDVYISQTAKPDTFNNQTLALVP